MKVNSLNSIVNLPKLCAGLKLTDYQFVKLPTFGWFCFNQDKSFVGNMFDIVPPDERGNLYRYIIKERPGWLDFHTTYSEATDQRLRTNLITYGMYQACYAMSKIEVERYEVKANGHKILLKDLMAENGLPYLFNGGVGVVTPLLRDRWAMLPWPKNAIGKLMVPSFCTPRHICSLDLVNWQTFERSATLYVNDERGWIGKLGTQIVRDLKEVGTSGGNTWDYKCDFWNDKIINISDLLPLTDYIKIWMEAKETLFSKSPLDCIVESGNVHELQNHISSLSYKQVEELEKATGQELSGYWKRAREHTIQLGSLTYVKRDNCYYVQKRGSLLQVSNFTLDIDEIVKIGTDFVRKGHIYFRDQITPVEIHSNMFDSHYKFKQGINKKFLECGIGVPIISPQFEHMILQIINSFNENAKVITS